jgi:hypothetical protein
MASPTVEDSIRVSTPDFGAFLNGSRPTTGCFGDLGPIIDGLNLVLPSGSQDALDGAVFKSAFRRLATS